MGCRWSEVQILSPRPIPFFRTGRSALSNAPFFALFQRTVTQVTAKRFYLALNGGVVSGEDPGAISAPVFFLRVFVCYALVHLLADYEIYLADIGANVNRYRIDE